MFGLSGSQVVPYNKESPAVIFKNQPHSVSPISGPRRGEERDISTGQRQFQDTHASQDCDPAPQFNQTDFASQLSAPNTQQLKLDTSTHPHSATNLDIDSTVSQSRSPAASWSRAALSFITSLPTSNNLYTSISNVVITANLYSGALLHPACALLAITNEAREKRRVQGEYNHPSPQYTGLTQRALDLWRSPGVYRAALSGVFIINAIESLAGANLLFSAIYTFACLGNIGAARTLNRDYFQGLYKARGQDYAPRDSTTLQLVTSPGINWSITDVLIGMMTLPTLGTIGTGVAFGATALACSTVAAPLLLGRRAVRSPLLLVCNGLSNFGFSAVHALWGTTSISIACCGWGIASCIIAAKQREHRTPERTRS